MCKSLYESVTSLYEYVRAGLFRKRLAAWHCAARRSVEFWLRNRVVLVMLQGANKHMKRFGFALRRCAWHVREGCG